MPTDAPFQPPRKKPSIFWWLGGLFLLLMLLFLLQLFGPSPQIIVSQQTTYITTPLQPNGLPDYEAYLLERSRAGVTPENNAAAILWPALWPGELRPSNYAAITTELGLHAIPSKSAALVPIYKQIAASLPKSSANLDGADKLLDQVISRPWTSAQYPSLGKWAADNKQPLDALIAGSHRSRCYFPSPSFLNKEPEVLVMMLLPGAQGVREAGRSLMPERCGTRANIASMKHGAICWPHTASADLRRKAQLWSNSSWE